jgi:hypothetical protein
MTVTVAVAVFAGEHATVAPHAFVPTGPEDTTEQAVLLTPTPPPVASPEGQLTCPLTLEPVGTGKSWLARVRLTPSEPFFFFPPFFFAPLMAGNPVAATSSLPAVKPGLALALRPSRAAPAAPMPVSKRTAVRRPGDVTESEPFVATPFDMTWNRLNGRPFFRVRHVQLPCQHNR